MTLLQMFFWFRQCNKFENLSIFDEVKAYADKAYEKVCQFFWATLYKVNIMTRNIKHMWPIQPMKILLECCLQAKSLSRASLVIINWLTAGQIEDCISFTPCIRALVYPEGVKEFKLHWMFLIVCLDKNTVQALLLCSLYPKLCTEKRQELHTYANFTFC